MKRMALALLLGAVSTVQAGQGPLFGGEWLGDRPFPRTFGIGADLFTMDQQYDIDRLAFTLPGVSLSDPSVIDVRNEIFHQDLKFDVWLLPFLNVFAVYGNIDGDTTVDLSRVPSQLPIPLGKLKLSYEGQVYGGGLTLVYGGEHWFASLTGTYADTDLSGSFASNVESVSWQPRIGLNHGPWQYWVGGFHLSAEEKHEGVFVFPGLGNVPFAVELSEQEQFNATLGAHYAMGDNFEMTAEFGGGDRDTTLVNLTWRF